jgi:hypothetical protein
MTPQKVWIYALTDKTGVRYISSHLNGRLKTAGGCIWKYEQYN